MTTPSQIIETARAEAQRTLEAAEATVIRDIDRVTVGPCADPAITPAWRGMTAVERRLRVRAEVLQAFTMRADDRYNDAIPRAIRAMIRILTTGGI